MAGTDGEFVDADDLGAGLTDVGQLLAHVLLVEFLDGVPVEVEVLGDILDRGEPAVTSDADGEAVGVARIVGEPVESFAFHGTTPPAGDAADGKLEVDASSAAVEIADGSRVVIVEGAMAGAAVAAECFFRSLRREMTTA